MTSPAPSQSFEEKLYAANRMRPRPEFLAGLRSRLAEQRPKGPLSFGERLGLVFRRSVWATVLLVIFLLAAAFIAVGPQRVLAAFQELFGYIPGVGIVDQSAPIRVLARPVSLTRSGISITVTSATLTADRTQVDFRIFGVPGSAYPTREDVHGCLAQPYLRLSDGTQLAMEKDFPPVPASVKEAVLVIPCIGETLPGKAPENWELPLRFVPAPPDFTVVPVIESLPSQTPTVSANTPTSEINPLTITKVLNIGDKFVLLGEFSYSADRDASLPAGSWWAIKQISITGADGQAVPQSYSNDFELPTPTRPDSETWLYQLDKNFIPPVTITYAGELISPVGPKEQAEFEFDAGANPQNGSKWTVNQDFRLGGYAIRLVSIESSSGGYAFHFKADPGASANAISVDILGYTPNCGGGGGGDQFPAEFDVEVCYASIPGGRAYPNGKLKAVLNFQALTRQDKSFQLQWSPDTMQTGPFATSTPQPGVCLMPGALRQLKPAPADLNNGTALMYGSLDSADKWGLVLYNLDGSGKQVLASDAGWGALSPDGSLMAYPGSNGIHVMDLATKTEKVLAGASGFDLHWSPDGKQIAYLGASTDHLFVVDITGAQARQVSDQSYESVIGWSPDSMQIYFAVPFTGGAAWKVYSFNLASAAVRDLFTIENGSYKGLNAAISPDGNWIAYPGRDGSLYLVHPDGSNLHTVLDNPAAAGIGAIQWSQSGWLGVSLATDSDSHTAVLLVKPEGCQVYLLQALHGELEGLSIP